MVSNTLRIEALERRVGELDGLDERVRDLGSVRLEPETTNALNRVAVLERDTTNLLARITAIERRENLSSTSHSPPREERMEAMERVVKDLKESLNDLVENCRVSVEAIKDEMLEMNTKLNLTMRAVGSQPATGPISMEYGRVKVP